MESAAPGILSLEGPLTMVTSGRLLASGRTLAEQGDCVADFSRVTECDSSALALLLEWLRSARASGHVFSTKALPEGLKSLADLYGITDILPPDLSAE